MKNTNKNLLINGSVLTKSELTCSVGTKLSKKMRDELAIFPTPFKGIYYVPFETERKAFYITYPYRVLFEAAKKILKTDDVYYGLETALYFEKKVWNPVPTHIINRSLSKKLKLKKEAKGYWRSKKRYSILKQFPYPVIFHKIGQKEDKGIKYKEGIAFSSFGRTKADATYLAIKGSREARNFIEFYIKRY